MKTFYRHISIIIVLLITSCSIFSQSGWFPCNTGINKNFTSVYFINQNTGWIAGYTNSDDYHGVILKTTDGGTNWTSQVDEYNIQPESIFFSDVNTGWVSGDRLFGADKTAVKKTTNAGLNWMNITLPDNTIHTFSVFFIGQNTGWISGRDVNNNVRVMKTMNGGANWLVIETGFITSSYGPKIRFINENTGYLAALQLLKTTNGGLNWNISDMGSTVVAAHPYFINENTGWVTGYTQHPAAYYIKKTTNGGNSWTTQWLFALAAGHAIFETYFVNSNTGWGAGYDPVNSSLIIKTTNGGASWGYQTSQVYSNALSSVFFIDANYGWSVGANGRVLRTTDGGGALLGLETIGNNIPDSYWLKQNYPNPFNPLTSISYSIKKSDNVIIKIYDINGCEVVTLVNEYKSMGIYTVSFDASKFASGMYLCRIISGTFTETKKMLLIK